MIALRWRQPDPALVLRWRGPDQAMAERAVRAIGLDVGGVDFLSTNIAESYKNIGGAICEVNAAPGFRMHVAPSEGTPRDAAGPVIDMLFPPGTPSRVPIAAVTGTNGKTTTARMLAHITKMAGYTPGLTTTDGVYIDGQRTVEGDMTGPVSARMVLADPQIDIAVLETARGGLVRAGMGVPEVNVGAVLNVQSDHLGMKGIDNLEQLAEVKRITGGVGVNVVLDMVAGDYVAREVEALAEDGRLVIIAVQGGIKSEFNAGLVLRRRLTITGSTLRPRPVAFKAAIAQSLLKTVWPWIESGRIKPVIHSVFGAVEAGGGLPSGAAQAHALMETNQHVGKLVMTW